MSKTPLKKLWKQFTHPKVQYLLLTLFFLLLLGGAIFSYNYFTVRSIRLVTTDKSKVGGFLSIQNKNIFFLNTSDTEKLLKSQNSYIDTVSVTKEYPHSITVFVKVLKPVAYLQTDEGYYILAANGRILEKHRGKVSQRPVITYYQKFPYNNYQAGMYMENQDILSSLYFMAQLRQLGIKIMTIDIAGFHMLGLYTDKDQSFIFNVEKDRTVQNYQVGEIIKQFKREGKDFKKIDVRFDKAVVTF